MKCLSVPILFFLLQLFQINGIHGSCGDPVVETCPYGFPVECKGTCGCYEDLVVDTSKIKELDTSFLGPNNGTYTKPTMKWKDCNKIYDFECSKGTKTALIYKEDDGDLTLVSADWKNYATVISYSCVNGKWNMTNESDDFDQLYYTCKS
ncbi:unnamed protein product [Caenorhabditis brenneri]